MDKRVIHLLLLIISIVSILTIGTFAWLNYRSKDTAMTLTIGDINDIQLTLKPYQLDLELLPVLTYTSLDANEEYVTVTVTNNSSQSKWYELYYDISEIDQDLQNSNFRYTVLKSTDNGSTYSQVKEGNFAEANTTNNFYIYKDEVPSNTTYKYKVYVWLYGDSNQSGLIGKTFKGDLRVLLGEPRRYAYFGGAQAGYKNSAYKDNITSIVFVNEINMPANAVNWNVGVSPSSPDDVKAWLEDDGLGNNTFILKIGANETIYAKNLMHAFFNLTNANSFNLDYLNTSETTDMTGMFSATGRFPTTVSLNLGNNFNTSKVTGMNGMFYAFGSSATTLTLNLGNNFDTGNASDFSSMFYWVGKEATTFNLNLGNKLNLSNATNTYRMFQYFGFSSQNNFEVDLSAGNFTNITDNSSMFLRFPTEKATVYVKDAAAQQWIINGSSDWSVTFSASNVLIK